LLEAQISERAFAEEQNVAVFHLTFPDGFRLKLPLRSKYNLAFPRPMTEVFMTREGSVAEIVERLVQEATASVEAALYRFNNPRLYHALEESSRRRVQVRLVIDQSKYQDDKDTQKLLSGGRILFRLLSGRLGPGSKMHHKFIVLDSQTVLTGSYNWTLESEKENYDNLVLLSEPAQVEIFRQEFEALWRQAAQQR
jgi:phosphatidylserine/phosphatidylglycerophosphate/cardiolipin synthase-like enzyme